MPVSPGFVRFYPEQLRLTDTRGRDRFDRRRIVVDRHGDHLRQRRRSHKPVVLPVLILYLFRSGGLLHHDNFRERLHNFFFLPPDTLLYTYRWAFVASEFTCHFSTLVYDLAVHRDLRRRAHGESPPSGNILPSKTTICRDHQSGDAREVRVSVCDLLVIPFPEIQRAA
jgi:hypothetical protein